MAQTPNLLLIWTDEQRPDTIGSYGAPHVHAPNLNALAERSFVFDNAYCCQPVCTPSRGCILTGTWPHEHGATANNVPLNRESRTIAELIDPTYRRAYHGKWHLGDEINAQHGFDEWVSIEDDMYRPYYSNPADLERRSDYHHFLVEQGYAPDVVAKDGGRCFSRRFSAVMAPQYTKAGFLGRSAARFLREHDPAQPFVLSVNFLEPHMPFYGPYNDRYDPEALPVGEAFGLAPDENASLRNRMTAEMYRQRGHEGYPFQTDWQRRRLRANYYGLVGLVDDAVGMIMQVLHDSGMADNTIVVFTSDHGEMMGDHALLAKSVLYEPAVRIPWLMHVPWLSDKQRHIGGRVSQIDMLPTLLDLMGQPAPDHLAGVSRRDVLEGGATLDDNDAFVIWEPCDVSVRDVEGYTDDQARTVNDGRWRTIVSADGWKLNLTTTDRCELFDLNSDPHELVNRIDEPDQQARIADLTDRVRNWQQQVGDDAPLP